MTASTFVAHLRRYCTGKCGHLCKKFDIFPLTRSFFTSPVNPFVKPRSACQPAGALSGQTGSTNPLSGWHKLYRTQTQRRIRKHHCHPGTLSKMLMWRIRALCSAYILKARRHHRNAERQACMRLKLRRYRAKPRS